MNINAFIALMLSIMIQQILNVTGDDRDNDLMAEIEKAKKKLETDFISQLWYGAYEATIESQDKILKMYTEYTTQQAQHVIEHLTLHRNITRAESAEKRANIISTKNLSKLVKILDCMFTKELDTLKAYKITGYNLHNCIRMAQNEMEAKYLELVENLKTIKMISLQAYDHYFKSLDNCVQSTCVASNLFQSIIYYQKLQEEVSSNMTEINNLSTRYVFSHIAMGCVSNSLTQISENYKIGADLVDECFLHFNGTFSRNLTENFDVKSQN